MISDETLNILAERFRALDLKGAGYTFADYLADQAKTEEQAEQILRRVRQARAKKVAARLTSNGNQVRLIHVAA